MEFHPRIDVQNPLIEEDKIVLGSFPIWTLSDVRAENVQINRERLRERLKNEEMDFYYGSRGNHFWLWYQKYLDLQISIKDASSIRNSLKENSIGITDLIVSCDRKGRSALDKHLTNRTYNHAFLKLPEKGEKKKILCTSKGVMNDMLLNKHFFDKFRPLKVNASKSSNFQEEIIKNIKGELPLVTKPFFQYIECDDGGTIEVFSLPSPGSPYRKLETFGLGINSRTDYLHNYLLTVFEWFKK